MEEIQAEIKLLGYKRVSSFIEYNFKFKNSMY